MHDASETVSFNTLHERLIPQYQESLASIVLDSGAAGPTLEDGMACIEALRRAHREVAARELKTRIKTAEREGRIQEAIELTQQLSHIR
jgi:hypothetical protein